MDGVGLNDDLYNNHREESLRTEEVFEGGESIKIKATIGTETKDESTTFSSVFNCR